MSELFHAFGIHWRLLVVQAVNFGIVLILLRYFLYTPVLRMLDTRRAVVKKGVDDARLAEEMLAGADAAVAQKIQDAETEAHGIIGRARTEAEDVRSRLIEEAKARADRTVLEAERIASETRAKSAQESEKEIARLAILAAEKVMRSRTTNS